MYIRKKLNLTCLIIFALCLTLISCASTQVRTYEEELTTWTSYKDVENWMDKYFTYDIPKYKKAIAKYAAGKPLAVPIKTPQETFQDRSGLCFDAAYFAQKTLNSINPSYEAEIVFIERRPYFKANHVVCSFNNDGELYIMDYGVPKKTNRRGVFGPFASLDQYAEFHIRQHPELNRIKSISFGWPDWYKVRVPE